MADPISVKDSDSYLNKNQLSKPNQYQSQHHEMKKRESDRFCYFVHMFFYSDLFTFPADYTRQICNRRCYLRLCKEGKEA